MAFNREDQRSREAAVFVYRSVARPALRWVRFGPEKRHWCTKSEPNPLWPWLGLLRNKRRSDRSSRTLWRRRCIREKGLDGTQAVLGVDDRCFQLLLGVVGGFIIPWVLIRLINEKKKPHNFLLCWLAELVKVEFYMISDTRKNGSVCTTERCLLFGSPSTLCYSSLMSTQITSFRRATRPFMNLSTGEIHS